jgi:hypothetical protein
MGGKGGNAYGAGIDDEGTSFVGSSLSLTNNNADGGAGGTGSTTGGSGGDALGGGMYAADPKASVAGSNFGDPNVPNSGNSAVGGAGGWPTISGKPSGPAGRADGGGLANIGSQTITANLTLTNDTFFDNLAYGGAGSITSDPNNGGGNGGGLFTGGVLLSPNNWSAKLTMKYVSFESNQAEALGGTTGGFGGGMAMESGNVTADYLYFETNTTAAGLVMGNGGAIGTYLGTFALTNSSGTGDVPNSSTSPPPAFVQPIVDTGIFDGTTNWNGSGKNDVN